MDITQNRSMFCRLWFFPNDFYNEPAEIEAYIKTIIFSRARYNRTKKLESLVVVTNGLNILHFVAQ